MSENHGDSNSLIGLAVDQGRYEIVKLIGEGGMGRVFKARQVSMDRMVALKILRAQMAQDPQLLARFQQEALSVSRLRHPNTITYFDYGRTEDDYLFIAMELLGGQSLFSLLRKQTRLPMGRMLHIMIQVVGAVAEAHRLGVVHRDLKPENIQIDEVAGDSDFVKVLDFGIAKIIQGDSDDEDAQKGITLAGTIFGTPHYMSPEQVHGRRVDHRTDIYSLGVIMYELLAGEPPFDGATPMAVMMAQASKPVPDITATGADVTPELAALITRCMAKDADERVQDADTLLNLLKHVGAAIGEHSGSLSGLLPASSVEQMRNTPGALAPLDSMEGARHTPAPSIDSQADAQRTPDHIGHLTVPPTEVSELDLEAPARGKGGLVALALVGLAAVGGAFFFFSSGPDEAPPEPPIVAQNDEPEVVAIGAPKADPKAAPVAAPEPADEPDAAAEPETPTPPKPVKGRYAVESVPAGAKVFIGDVEVGETPFELVREVGDAPVVLRFERKGYKDAEHSQLIAALGEGAEVPTIQVKLERRRRYRPKPKPKPVVEPKPKPKPKPKPTGYEKL